MTMRNRSPRRVQRKFSIWLIFAGAAWAMEAPRRTVNIDSETTMRMARDGMLAKTQLLQLLALVEETVPEGRRDRLFEVMQEMASYHPEEPHWYLPLIGVDPGAGHHRVERQRPDPADRLPSPAQAAHHPERDGGARLVRGQRAERELAPACEQFGLSIVPYAPLHGGLLASLEVLWISIVDTGARRQRHRREPR